MPEFDTRRVLAEARKQGALMKMWGNLSVLGQLALTQGDYELARDRWEEAAQIAHDMKEGRKETLTRGFLAYLARDYEEGKSLCEKAAEMSRESGEKGDAAACLIWAAYCAEGAGDLSGRVSTSTNRF